MDVIDAVIAGLILIALEEVIRRFAWPRVFGKADKGDAASAENHAQVVAPEPTPDEDLDEPELAVLEALAADAEGWLWIGELEHAAGSRRHPSKGTEVLSVIALSITSV